MLLPRRTVLIALAVAPLATRCRRRPATADRPAPRAPRRLAGSDGQETLRGRRPVPVGPGLSGVGARREGLQRARARVPQQGERAGADPARRLRGRRDADGPRGWRIELKGAADRSGNKPNERSNIQLHIGSRPSDAIGCIVPLIADADAADASCASAGTRPAMDRLRTAIGGGANRKVLLRVQT